MTFAPGAVELLLAKVGANTRLLFVEEVRKLATYVGLPADLSAKLRRRRPRRAGGSLDPARDGRRPVIEESPRHRAHPQRRRERVLRDSRRLFQRRPPLDARRVAAALLLRRRRAAGHRRAAKPQPHPAPASCAARRRRGAPRPARGGRPATRAPPPAHAAKIRRGRGREKAPTTSSPKTPWYLGKLASGKLPSLRRLIDNQHELIAAFEEIIRRPDEQEEVLRAMAVRCPDLAS